MIRVLVDHAIVSRGPTPCSRDVVEKDVCISKTQYGALGIEANPILNKTCNCVALQARDYGVITELERILVITGEEQTLSKVFNYDRITSKKYRSNYFCCHHLIQFT